MGHVTVAEVEDLVAELDDLKRRFDAQLAHALDEIERLRAENEELRAKLAPDTTATSTHL